MELTFYSNYIRFYIYTLFLVLLDGAIWSIGVFLQYNLIVLQVFVMDTSSNSVYNTQMGLYLTLCISPSLHWPCRKSSKRMWEKSVSCERTECPDYATQSSDLAVNLLYFWVHHLVTAISCWADCIQSVCVNVRGGKVCPLFYILQWWEMYCWNYSICRIRIKFWGILFNHILL